MSKIRRILVVTNTAVLVAAVGFVGYGLQAQASVAQPAGSTSAHAGHAAAPRPASPTPSQLSKADAAAAGAANPNALLRQLGQRIVAKDIDGIIALHEQHAAIVNYDLTVIRGRQDIRAFYLDWFKSNPVLTVNPLQTTISGGQKQPDGTLLNRTASIMGTYSLTQDAADGTRETFTGNFCDIVRQQPDGTWLYVQDNPYPPHQ